MPVRCTGLEIAFKREPTPQAPVSKHLLSTNPGLYTVESRDVLFGAQGQRELRLSRSFMITPMTVVVGLTNGHGTRSTVACGLHNHQC